MSSKLNLIGNNLAAEIESMAGDFANNSDQTLRLKYGTSSFKTAVAKILNKTLKNQEEANLADVWSMIGAQKNPYPNWSGLVVESGARKGFRKAKYLFRQMLWKLINTKDNDENN
jgi:hypothetical protein